MVRCWHSTENGCPHDPGGGGCGEPAGGGSLSTPGAGGLATMVGAYGGARLAALPWVTDALQMTLFAV
ncbi:MAG: hypothetical protein Q6L50_10470, partial [Gloeomargarita sp. GMQP_bins_120]